MNAKATKHSDEDGSFTLYVCGICTAEYHLQVAASRCCESDVKWRPLTANELAPVQPKPIKDADIYPTMAKWRKRNVIA